MKHSAIKQMSAVALVLGAFAVANGCASLIYTPWDSTGATTFLPVALVSMETDIDPGVSRATMARYVNQAVADHPDLRLISFGEASLGFYAKIFGPAEYQRGIAEAIDGPTVSLMRNLAAQHQVYISFGFTELENGNVYDSAIIIDDSGNIIAHRHKSNFVIFDYADHFTPGGKGVTTAYIDGIKVSFLICNDFNDPDYQAAVNADVDSKILLLPQASAGLKADFVKTQPQPFIGKWFLAPQRYGNEELSMFYGSFLVDPNGYMVSAAAGPGYSYYVLAIK